MHKRDLKCEEVEPVETEVLTYQNEKRLFLCCHWIGAAENEVSDFYGAKPSCSPGTVKNSQKYYAVKSCNFQGTSLV